MGIDGFEFGMYGTVRSRQQPDAAHVKHWKARAGYMNNGLEDLSTGARSNLAAMSWNVAAYRMLEWILVGPDVPDDGAYC